MSTQAQSVAETEQLREAAKFPRALSFLFQEKCDDGETRPRYRVGHGGRGGTKTWGFARARLMLGVQKSLRTLCGREYQNSIKESVHKVLADQITELRQNYIYEVQQQVIKAREGVLLPDGEPNKSEFIFKGFHQDMGAIKSTEGLDCCWVEEADNVSKYSWDTLDPTVRKEDSEIWISFNAKLESDETYQRFVVSPPQNAIVRKLTWRDNPFFPEVLRVQKDQMRLKDPDSYLNVWEGEPRLMLEGAVYADELRRVRASGRICQVPYDPAFPVDVIFDLGRADYTAMWFRQRIAYENRMLRYYFNSLEEPEHYFEYMDGLGYSWGTIWLPHDAKAKRLGTKRSIEEQFRQKFGSKNVRIVPNLSIADGIAAARSGFGSTYFDRENAKDGVQALSHYRYEVLENSKKNPDGSVTLSRVPAHDWASHGADAYRYEAITRKLGFAKPSETEKRRAVRESRDQTLANEEWQYGRPARGHAQGWMRR